jgi:hypothetical protein
MESKNIFIVHPENSEQVNALKTFIKSLNMKLEIISEPYYNPDFVAKINKSREEFQSGNSILVEKEDLQSFLGIQ